MTNEFADLMDRRRFDELLGEMLGSIAELESDGHNVIYVADAAVMAAIRVVHRSQPPSVADAWAKRIKNVLEGRIRLCDDLADETRFRVERERLY